MKSQTRRSRWYWMLTSANLIISVLLVCFVFLIMTVLAAFASGVITWPAFVMVSAGLVLTAASWRLAGSVIDRTMRWVGYALNGSALAIYMLLITGVALIFLHTTRRLFLVPSDYQGELHIIHLPGASGKEKTGFERTTYRFPENGIVITTDHAPSGYFRDEYDSVGADGGGMSWLTQVLGRCKIRGKTGRTIRKWLLTFRDFPAGAM